MKKEYEKPKLISEEFAPQVFLAGCGQTSNVVNGAAMVCWVGLSCSCLRTTANPIPSSGFPSKCAFDTVKKPFLRGAVCKEPETTDCG